LVDEIEIARCKRDLEECLGRALLDTSNVYWYSYVNDFLLTRGYDHRQAVKVLCHGELTTSEVVSASSNDISFTMAMKQTESVHLLHLRCFFNIGDNKIYVCDAFHADELTP
jgi:hypothetical protein